MTSIFFVHQCIIKELLDSVFVISRIIKVRVISLSLRFRLITVISTLIILDIAKISSNNCLELSTSSHIVDELTITSRVAAKIIFIN